MPAKKSKNKELKKFFDEDNSEKPDKPKVKPTMMDKMAEITKEIEKEKEIDAIVLEKKIKELQWKYKTNRSRSGSRGRRSSSRRSRSRSRDRRSRGRRDERRKRSGSRGRRSRSRDGKSRSRGEVRDGEEEGGRETPEPDPNTKEGRLELYRLELEKKANKFLAKEKKNRGKTADEIDLEKTRAFKYVSNTPSPEPEVEQDEGWGGEEGEDEQQQQQEEEEEEEIPDVPGEEDRVEDPEEEKEAGAPEAEDGLSPRTRAKNRVADVIAKINNIVPPENYKPDDPADTVRPETQMKEKPIMVGGYFARVITEEDERERSRSRSRDRRRSKRSRSRPRRRSRKLQKQF